MNDASGREIISPLDMTREQIEASPYSFAWKQGGYVGLTVPHSDEFGDRVIMTHGLSIGTARELHKQLTAVLDMIKGDAEALAKAHPLPNKGIS